MTNNKNLNILLISPKGLFFSSNKDFIKFLKQSKEMKSIHHYWNGASVSLITLACLTPNNHNLTIIDENYEEIDFNANYDVIGISAMTQQAGRAYEIATNFKKRNKYVVIGGIHSTVMPKEAQKYADTIFIGEAENTWPEFINDYCQGKPKQIYNQFNHDPIDIKKILTPRYDLIAKYKYPVIWIQTTRGCPHDCEFCASSTIYGKRYKSKTIEQVLNEIRTVKKYWRFTQIGFADDNMFVNRNFTLQLINEFKKINFNWYAQTDISIAQDKKLLEELHNSGCRILFIGFESIKEENLKTINRNKWKAKMYKNYEKYIYEIQRHGIGVYGAFIIGFDDDNTETIKDTINFVKKNNIMGVQITVLTPFPGTRLRDRMEKENRILSNNWELYTGWNSVIKHNNFSQTELEKGILNIYENIYNKENYKRRFEYFNSICQRLVN